MLLGFATVGGTEYRSHAGAAELGPRDDDVGTMIVGPATPGVSPVPRNDGIRYRDRSRASAAELGLRDDDVRTMIVGGPTTPGVSPGPRNDRIGNRDGSRAGVA